ncbi:MAG: hypothetical protein N2114_03815 [Candidatus Goldbacteria bacterium]|nr:hypothetical protein [Candidatus Goldiibacteriota bacterium]
MNNEEKQMAKSLSAKEGLNVSQFFIKLLWERKEKKKTDIHNEIVTKYEGMLEKYRKVYNEYKK